MVVNAYVLKDEGESILLVLSRKLILYSKDLVELREISFNEILNDKLSGVGLLIRVSRNGFSEQESDNNIYFWAVLVGDGIENFKTSGL